MANYTLSLQHAPLGLAVLIGAEVDFEWPKALSYVEPRGLKPGQLQQYREQLDWIGRQYQALSNHAKNAKLAPHVLPYAARVNMRLTADENEFLAAAGRLRNIETDYTQALADSLLSGFGRKKLPAINSDAIEPGGTISNRRETIRLVERQPLNEMSLGLRPYYALSDQNWQMTQAAYAQSEFGLKAHLTRQALAGGYAQSIVYVFELTVEPWLLQQARSLGLLTGVQGQLAVPTHGYHVDDNLRDGGMVERCFDLSYKLYDMLQSVSPSTAQLSVLYGHRQRYLVKVSETQLQRVFTPINQKGPLERLRVNLAEAIGLKHPLVAEFFSAKL